MKSSAVHRKTAILQTLTSRQTQVIIGLMNGLSCKEIGARLNISPRCVKFHAGEIYRRYGVCDRQTLLLKFGRFEIDIRWVPAPPTTRPARGLGGTR